MKDILFRIMLCVLFVAPFIWVIYKLRVLHKKEKEYFKQTEKRNKEHQTLRK